MGVLTRKTIIERLETTDVNTRLIVTPLLFGNDQIGLSSVDLRLGNRFKVDLRTREPYIGLVASERPVSTFFDETYRDFGENFLLYPGQLVLACTFEYLRIPYDLVGHLASRSSLNRLGVSFYSIIHPGYTGALTFELTNSTSNPVALVPGMRIAQLQLHDLDMPVEEGYARQVPSKYVANTQPKVSEASGDEELSYLDQLGSKHGARFW